jgi:SAM-dependent methyltransferase
MEPLPLRLGTPEQFAAVRELLAAANFTEAAICERLGIAAFTEFGPARRHRLFGDTLSTAFDALAHLFLECVAISRAEAGARLGPEGLSALEELGLLAPDASDAARVVSPVGLAPTRSLWLVSDRGGELAKLAGDVVYPAILENTQAFLSIIPETPCKNFLDLGAGTGVAALMAARGFAEHAWACDITARSAHFSEFNRRLNAIENVTVGQGDLYEPVEGQQFDRIVTHPPYVPVAKPTCVFRDGGEDGEQIIRRIVEGLPRHLAPGGRFYAQTLVSDREGEPAETRVRSWLGGAHAEFDVAIIAETAREPFDFIGRAMQRGTHYPEELRYWSASFQAMRVKYLVYGSIIVQRHETARDPFTIRFQKGPRSGPAETDWALRWYAEAYSASYLSILNSRLRLSPELTMAVLHKLSDGSLAPEEFLLRVKYPFDAECKIPRWCAALVLACDGVKTGAEILDTLQQNGAVEAKTDPAEFTEAIKVLLSSGFLISDALPVCLHRSTSSPAIRA